MATNNKKYVVAPGYCLVIDGRTFNEGDEISSKNVPDKSMWARLLHQKKVIEKPAANTLSDIPEAEEVKKEADVSAAAEEKTDKE